MFLHIPDGQMDNQMDGGINLGGGWVHQLPVLISGFLAATKMHTLVLRTGGSVEGNANFSKTGGLPMLISLCALNH